MEASELRIGNFITHEDYSSDCFSVLSISENVVNTKGGKSGAWVNPPLMINPIPITEEWLAEFGFGKHGGQNYGWFSKRWVTVPQEQVNEICININTGLCSIGYDASGEDEEVGCAYTKIPIKFVHLLQNLWYALTGEELIISQ